MLFGTALLAGACEPARAPEARGVRGKRELFGDPALVPTRAGERAREELALADAVAASLQALGAEALAVEVRLPGADDPGAVVVAGLAPPGWDAAATTALVGELCGTWSAGRVRVAWRGAAPSGPAEGPRDLPLLFALVGLGAAGGVTLDRALRRRARSPLRG
ncbi:hypothetical protein [Nannocystis bainbridge]|uniref:Uncharacterized protein n=1 Tax=Nannocystis bainbridge TaxID=2995303 RepID=A0ABT5DNN0_9BACT|nr:hypothetical protein [Nannocystis bainbridge]MDC0715256.1 hypothetical protein [Nannocystis bainbridge]